VFAKEEVDVDFSSSSAGEFSTRAVLNADDEFRIAGTDGLNDGDIRVLVFSNLMDTLKSSTTVSNFHKDGNSYTYRFKVELTGTNPVDPIDIWILGNAGAKWDAVAESLIGSSKSDVRAALEYGESSGVTQVAGGAPAATKTLFPLWGVINDAVVEKSQTEGASSSTGQVKARTASATADPITTVGLYRMVAKIDVYLSGVTAKANHSVKKVIFYNRDTVGSLVPYPYTAPTDPSKGFTNPTTVVSPTVNDSAHSVTYDAVTDTVSNSIYAFEVDADGGNEYTKEPCLILGATYTSTSPITWYRVPFVDANGQRIDIIRNKRYVVRVTALSSEGSSTPDIALNTVNVNNITASVVAWDDVLIDFPD
jgi:hypothetical protein